MYERIAVSPRRRANTAGDSSSPSVPRVPRFGRNRSGMCTERLNFRTESESLGSSLQCEMRLTTASSPVFRSHLPFDSKLPGSLRPENQKPADSRRSEFDFPLVDKERVWNIMDVMNKIAKEHNSTPARIALAWLLAKPVVTSVIIGAKNIKQLEDNCASVNIKLTEGQLKSLDEVSMLPPEYPGWMIPFQSSDRLDPKLDRFAKLKESLANGEKTETLIAAK